LWTVLATDIQCNEALPLRWQSYQADTRKLKPFYYHGLAMKKTVSPVILSAGAEALGAALTCHPERSEGSLACWIERVGPQILRSAQDDI